MDTVLDTLSAYQRHPSATLHAQLVQAARQHGIDPDRLLGRKST
jgi:hypothetical protein